MSDVADGVEESRIAQEMAAEERDDSTRSLYLKATVMLAVLIVGYLAYRRYFSSE